MVQNEGSLSWHEVLFGRDSDSVYGSYALVKE